MKNLIMMEVMRILVCRRFTCGFKMMSTKDGDLVLPSVGVLGRTDKVRGIGLHVAGEEAQDTSDSEGEESGFVANDDARIEESEEEEDELEDKPAPILVDNATRRIAVQHLDWGIIRARDLLVLFRSFCPEDGEVRRVTVNVTI